MSERSDKDWASAALGPTVEQENRTKAETDARRIKETLRANSDAVIALECFSRSEVELIRSLLTTEESGRVMFSWVAPTGATP